jgi:uncharacterized protein
MHVIEKSSSHKWSDAIKKVADQNIVVQYAGSFVAIDKGDVYYEDNSGNVLIGWHGTYNPPTDMDGNTLVSQ